MAETGRPFSQNPAPMSPKHYAPFKAFAEPVTVSHHCFVARCSIPSVLTPVQKVSSVYAAQADVNASDWVKRNRAFKKKAGLWSMSRPLPRLTALSLCASVMDRMMHGCLHVASKQWEREQQQKVARGQARTYRMVHAASQADLKVFYAGMLHMLLLCPDVLATADKNLETRSMLSRLISRSMSSMHQLLRRHRRGQPYKLFLALQTGMYDQDPECMWGELTSAFRKWWPRLNAEAKSALEMLADVLDMDISAIESRHALARRLAILRGTQVPVPRVRTTAAEWTLKQIAVQETDHTPPMYRRGEHGKVSPSQPKPPKKAGKKDGARGGGGGPWKAYLHTMHAGRKFTAASIRELRDAYNSLSEEEMSHSARLGHLGNLAWRSGHASFGERDRSSGARARAEDQSLVLPGIQAADSGAWVQGDAPAEQLAIIPFATREFDHDLRVIRKKFHEEHRKHVLEEESLEIARAASQDKLLASVPELVSSTPAAQTFGSGHSGGQNHDGHVKWFPPCRAFAEARYAGISTSF